jgi:hypothetical protein
MKGNLLLHLVPCVLCLCVYPQQVGKEEEQREGGKEREEREGKLYYLMLVLHNLHLSVALLLQCMQYILVVP